MRLGVFDRISLQATWPHPPSKMYHLGPVGRFTLVHSLQLGWGFLKILRCLWSSSG